MFVSVKRKVSTALLCLMVMGPVAASAEAATSQRLGADPSLVIDVNLVQDTGAANRIIAGDLLRTLSQEIPAAACHLHNGVDVEEAAELLEYSVAKFDVTTDALLNGNEAMGIIGGETRRKTLVVLENLIADWQPIHDAALTVLADPSDAAAAETVYASTDTMLEKTYVLLSMLEGEYAIPTEIIQADVMLLEVSGRMAAMTQRMAYEACRVWSGDANEELVGDLEKTVQIFEASMNALRGGLPELGILPAPTSEIAAGLDVVAADWGMIGGYLDQVLAGSDVSLEVREDLYHQLAVKLHKVEEIEELYQDYSKRVIH